MYSQQNSDRITRFSDKKAMAKAISTEPKVNSQGCSFQDFTISLATQGQPYNGC